MANTLMTAKNTFREGLIMDFAPDNTQATCLTSALNATLLTFNGNEMSLQNDMGNGRVETARLPDGYVPVGSCEFGDIIYIVSYNPITNKSQIGCFPSPERNISSQEVSEIGQSLSYLDFQIVKNGQITGDLKNASVKKVLIENKKLNPGDKYIIYTNSKDSLTDNRNCLSDFTNIAEHNNSPKYVKLHVVSIDDAGKITYLDTTTKWYDIQDTNILRKYYISSQKIGSDGADLDEHRNLIESNWSIFSSKVSGKLAILAELEMIDTFSCSYDLEYVNIKTEGKIKYKNYKLYLVPSYTAKDGITLPYVCVTSASFNISQLEDNNSLQLQNIEKYQVYYYNGTGETGKYSIYNATSIREDSNNTGYKIDSNKIYIGDISIPYQQQLINGEWSNISSTSFIYNMEVTPAMAYGRLGQFAVSISIDFNKIGTGDIGITDWKYYNAGTTSILSFGIEAYPKPNWNIDSIIMHFYDNQGLVGEYLLNDKVSYSGVFTEYLGLDGESINSRFSRYNSINNQLIQHKGNIVDNLPSNYDPNDYIIEGDTIYMNDAGTLYSNFLYGVKIIIKQSHVDNKNDSDDKTVYRWFWTTSMFNEYYYSIRDFNILNFELILNGEVLYESNPKTYVWNQKEINNLGNSFSETENTQYKTYSANIQYIGQDLASNLNMYVRAGLQENYGCFNLYKGTLQDINLDIYLSTGKILYSLKKDNQYQFSDKETNVTDPEYLRIETIIKTDGNGSDGFKYLGGTPLNDKKITDNYIQDDFNITFSDGPTKTKFIEDDEGYNTNCQIIETTLDQCYFASQTDKKGIPLTLAATLLNKAYTQNIYDSTVQVPVYLPLINDKDDLRTIGITYCIPPDNTKSIYLGFYKGMNMCLRKNDFSATDFILDENTLYFISATQDDQNNVINKDIMIDPSTYQEYITNVWGMFSAQMPKFFPVYLGGNYGTRRYYVLNGNSPQNYANVQKWQTKRTTGLYKNNGDTADVSKVTESTFDINASGNFTNVNNSNTTLFLGAKYKDGFTLFNAALMDSYTNNPYFKQQDRFMKSGEYHNFAYQLYLILSNTYHKDKRAEDQLINIRNFVRNGDYDIQLVKNIIIKLYQKNNVTHNILMQGMDFNLYVSDIEKILTKEDSSFDINIIKNNITLKFLDYAHNSQLQINVNNSPMSFLNSSTEAYILRNGVLQGISGLGNQFYIYQNGELEIFQNKILKFKVTDVLENIKYILGNAITGENITLPGAPLQVQTLTNGSEEAYNYYLSLIQKYVNNTQSISYAKYYSHNDAVTKLNECLEQLYESLPDTYETMENEKLQTYYKKSILQQMYSSGLLYNANSTNTSPPQSHDGDTPFFWIQHNIDSPESWRIITTPYAGSIKNHQSTSEYYEVNTYLGLNKWFKYENGLVLDPSITHDNFGITDGVGHNYGYCGFLEDVVLDKNYQVL